MAFSKALIAFMLLSLFLLQFVHALESQPSSTPLGSGTGTGTGSVKIDCGAACAVRCSATKRPNLCKRACGSCCNKCNCVPPGTSGNYEICPCYGSLTTHGTRRKCP